MKIVLYDVLGREVSNIFDHALSATSYILDPSILQLQSGTYYCVLTVSDAATSTRIVKPVEIIR